MIMEQAACDAHLGRERGISRRIASAEDPKWDDAQFSAPWRRAFGIDGGERIMVADRRAES